MQFLELGRIFARENSCRGIGTMFESGMTFFELRQQTKIALQRSKTGKFDYFRTPNQPARSRDSEFFTDDELASNWLANRRPTGAVSSYRIKNTNRLCRGHQSADGIVPSSRGSVSV